MLRRTFTTFFMCLFVVGFVQAQEKTIVKVKKDIPLNNLQQTVNTQVNYTSPLDPGQLFITTDYDYAGNNVIPNMIMVGPDIDAAGTADPIFTAMRRQDQAAQRDVMFGYYAFGLIDAFNAFDATVS